MSSCRSAARRPATPSRPAPAPRRGAVRHHHRRHGAAALPARTCTTASPTWHRKADGNCAIDYGFHQIIGGVDEQSLKALNLPHRARGHHQLQAVHGLPGRVLQRRRPDPARHADGRRLRRHDHDARRERHRHRRARAAGARPRRDRPEVPLATPARRCSRRGDAPGDRAQPRRRQRAAVHRPHVGRRRARTRSPPPVTRAATCSPRRARSTCT